MLKLIRNSTTVCICSNEIICSFFQYYLVSDYVSTILFFRVDWRALFLGIDNTLNPTFLSGSIYLGRLSVPYFCSKRKWSKIAPRLWNFQCQSRNVVEPQSCEIEEKKISYNGNAPFGPRVIKTWTFVFPRKWLTFATTMHYCI